MPPPPAPTYAWRSPGTAASAGLLPRTRRPSAPLRPPLSWARPATTGVTHGATASSLTRTSACGPPVDPPTTAATSFWTGRRCRCPTWRRRLQRDDVAADLQVCWQGFSPAATAPPALRLGGRQELIPQAVQRRRQVLRQVLARLRRQPVEGADRPHQDIQPLHQQLHVLRVLLHGPLETLPHQRDLVVQSLDLLGLLKVQPLRLVQRPAVEVAGGDTRALRGGGHGHGLCGGVSPRPPARRAPPAAPRRRPGAGRPPPP